jgi:hypothetical protein
MKKQNKLILVVRKVGKKQTQRRINIPKAVKGFADGQLVEVREVEVR